MKTKLLGKTPEELKRIVTEEGLPGFTAQQIAQWMYVRKVRSIEEMTNISKAGRQKLSEKYEVGVGCYAGMAESVDGTKKYLFPVGVSDGIGQDGRMEHLSADAHEDARAAGQWRGEMETKAVEAVMIPDGDRATLCVSSQSGCRMGCRFCMTGRQGFHGHLSAAEILSQKFNIAALVLFTVSRFICTWFLRYISPGRLLSVLAVAAIVAVCGTILFTDRRGLYCLVAVSGCMSLMFPTIYGIALRGLGDNVKIGGAGLIMSILGGSVFPPLQAALIDGGFSVAGLPATNTSFIVPFVCFVVVAVYWQRAYLREQTRRKRMEASAE